MVNCGANICSLLPAKSGCHDSNGQRNFVYDLKGLAVCNKLQSTKLTLAPNRSYIEVPKCKHGSDHGGGGAALPIGAVEQEGGMGVLRQSALHSLEELVKVLRVN